MKSASVIIDGQVKSNLIATQEIHRPYGGVVGITSASAKYCLYIMEALKEASYDKELDAIVLLGVDFALDCGVFLQNHYVEF
jgi:N6-L-threonylcarbamoyladenine synthase